MMKSTKERISIKRVLQLWGQLVVVDRYTVRTDNGDFTPIPIEPRTGRVVGVRWLRAGRAVFNYEAGYPFNARGPAVPHLIVCFWPSQRPVKVPLDGWRLRDVRAEKENPDPLPWDGQWDEKQKADASLCAIDLPRDERGRFV